VAGVQREQKSQKLLAVLQETIKALVKEGIEIGEPVSYQHPLAQRLCAVLELILSFGLKGMILLSLSLSLY
jgi:citrate lyase alpha subunit